MGHHAGLHEAVQSLHTCSHACVVLLEPGHKNPRPYTHCGYKCMPHLTAILPLRSSALVYASEHLQPNSLG